ncbi:MAG: HPP family protein [Collimonas pratensis]|uniref:HPP family protein n=1 Tax=Collimonas pratensis TaxID=279113 RepID=UPI003C708EBA
MTFSSEKSAGGAGGVGPSADGSRISAHAAQVLRAGLGAFLALAAVGGLAQASHQPWILGSFGATCVLLFGFPNGPFSQPRNIIGGHLLTTFTGLLFLQLCGPGWLPMAVASACALMLMMLTRTVHPPAGSNPAIVFMAQPGWSFLLLPTLAGAALILLIGWLYWRLLQRRRWPGSWY